MAANEARRDLAEKLRFERLLIEEIRAFNKQLVRQTVREFAQGAGAFDASTLQSELTGILDEHYERVGEPFSQQLTEVLPEDIKATDSELALIATALLTFFSARAIEQAAIITATNQRDIAASIDLAVTISQEEAVVGRPQSRRDTAVQTGANLSRKLNARVGAIASLETQASAEAAKATEAQVLTGQPPSVTGGSPRDVAVPKEWVTMGDEVVREDHVLADSQEINLNQAFDVGGEQLRWPGDTSLGASAGNVINCRCSSVVNAENVFAERRRRGEQPFIDITASGNLYAPKLSASPLSNQVNARRYALLGSSVESVNSRTRAIAALLSHGRSREASGRS